MTISFDRKLRAAPDTLINMIEGEAVLLNLKSESYFGLDEMGAEMWTALTGSDSIGAAYRKLLDEYDVEPDRLRADLSALVDQLVEKGLVEVAGE
ncbi:MAG: PqqD family protein [Blastocatellia bacterium]